MIVFSLRMAQNKGVSRTAAGVPPVRQRSSQPPAATLLHWQTAAHGVVACVQNALFSQLFLVLATFIPSVSWQIDPFSTNTA